MLGYDEEYKSVRALESKYSSGNEITRHGMEQVDYENTLLNEADRCEICLSGQTTLELRVNVILPYTIKRIEKLFQ